MNNEALKHADFTMMYVVRDCMRAIKKEMDDKGLTFDEIMQLYEQLIEQAEKTAGV